MATPLDDLARRAALDPYFLGFDLAVYADAETLDDAGLAQALGCEPGALTMIRLCRAPREESAAFRRDVEQVAERFGADAGQLARVVRHARAVRALRSSAGRGGLLAARDAEVPPEAEP